MPNHLLIPGTSGTKLLLDGQDIGWPLDTQLASWFSGGSKLVDAARRALGVATATEVERLLSMEFRPGSLVPTKTTLAKGSMTAGPVLSVAYNQFKGFQTFPYDWRSDIRESGAQLLTFLKGNKPSNRRWKLVCHSQGGLVVAAAAYACARENAGSDVAFSKLVSHVVFVGVPFYGTINAVDALVRGEALGANFARDLLKALRTWPALYQMLPAWPGSVRIVHQGEIKRLKYTSLEDEAWTGYAQVSQALLARARQTRKQVLDAPLSMLNGIRSLILMSRGHRTRTFVLKGGGKLVFPDGVEVGDTLVPYDTTRAMMNEVEYRRCWGLGKLGEPVAEHFMLANDPVFSRAVKAFLDNEAVPT